MDTNGKAVTAQETGTGKECWRRESYLTTSKYFKITQLLSIYYYIDSNLFTLSNLEVSYIGNYSL